MLPPRPLPHIILFSVCVSMEACRMPELILLHTPRLILRQWTAQDRPAFFELNTNPEVMAFFLHQLQRRQSDMLADICESHIATHGWGLWALEAPGVSPFIGFVGLSVATFDAPFCPCVEIGWRLARRYWDKGYATETAEAALAVGFEQLALENIVSFTSQINTRSRAVMERLGMHKQLDFDLSNLPAGHKLTPHVLYQLSQRQWQQRR